MRTFAVLLTLSVVITPVFGAAPVTVAQLEQFLTSSHAAKLPDAEIAERLGRVTLSEQLTGTTLARIESHADLGPKTLEQLELLAAVSTFAVPPSVELLHSPPPGIAMQQQMMQEARDYANGALRLLPDLLALRITQSFNDLPVVEGTKHSKPKIQMHIVGESRHEIAVRAGHEVNRPIGGAGDAIAGANAPAGLSTWGEFGAILALVLQDSFQGSLRWSRWQWSESGKQVAVFRYAIPRSASHNSIDFCCYARSEDAPESASFHDRPGYHGEVYIDPATGQIDRITLQADLQPGDPVSMSNIAVQYGSVRIAEKFYICPIRSVAVSQIHSGAVKKIDGIGLETNLNVVQFRDYHKFGSTVRVVTNDPD